MSIIKKSLTIQTKNIVCPSQDEQKGEKEEHDDDSRSNILTKEIDSWSNFEYALREENRLLFNKMLDECKENDDFVRTANSKDEYFSAESLFMVLILQQQKMINELIGQNDNNTINRCYLISLL
jgi:hypothetical protein